MPRPSLFLTRLKARFNNFPAQSELTTRLAVHRARVTQPRATVTR